MIYGKEELELIGKLYDAGHNREDIASECNKTYHEGRPTRTARGIEFALGDKLNRKNDRFSHICEVCKTPFKSGWSNARYCGDECRAVVDREYANRQYRIDPKTNLQQQSIRKQRRIEDRWITIFLVHGNRCNKCKQSYPRVVYDLHHFNGKQSRKDAPARIIRDGTDEKFKQLLKETQLLCANCHRLHHAETGDWAPMRKGM